MLGKELAMTGKIAHVAERKGFELALNGVMKRAQGNRNEGYVEVINAMGLVNKRVGLIRSASGLAASRPLRYASTCMYWYCISWKTDSWTAPVCF